jgi:hypothetical protein
MIQVARATRDAIEQTDDGDTISIVQINIQFFNWFTQVKATPAHVFSEGTQVPEPDEEPRHAITITLNGRQTGKTRAIAERLEELRAASDGEIVEVSRERLQKIAAVLDDLKQKGD